jgi:hypothetical protein
MNELETLFLKILASNYQKKKVPEQIGQKKINIGFAQ